MTPSPALVDFVKRWEGCALKPYADAGGTLTIGYGHLLPPKSPRYPITQAQADEWLGQDLGTVSRALTLSVPDTTTQQQFDAVTSLAFNVGVRAVESSTLMGKLAAGDVQGAAAEFPRWCHDNGHVLTGLFKRRIAEQHIFLNGDYSGAP